MGYGFGKLNEYADRAYENSKAHGFWDGLNPEDIWVTLGKLALITEEVGEAVSAVRHTDNANLAEELSDIVIRVMDLAVARGINLEHFIVDKMDKNESRPRMHGKKA